VFTFPSTLYSGSSFSNTLSTAFVSDDTATVTPDASLSSDITTKLTVALWVKGPSSSNDGVVTHYTNSGNQRKWAIFTGTGGADFRVLLSSSGSDVPKDFRSADTVFSSETWHLIGFSYDGDAATTSQLKVYTDGVCFGLIRKPFTKRT